MKRHPLFYALGYAANIVLIASILLIVFGGVWEYSTRRYLKGFADAVVPYSNSPEEKIQAILTWMEHGPQRQALESAGDSTGRDPEDTLNYLGLLQICGTGTNAFVNLADSTGLEARRLLLLDSNGGATHVVAEIHVDGRWIIVDPTFHRILRDASGRLLTRKELADRGIFRQATQDIPHYDTRYEYLRTTHLRLQAIPLIGGLLRRMLEIVYPNWEDAFDWTLLAERESFATLVIGILILLIGFLFRLILDYYGKRWLGIGPIRLRDQLGLGRLLLLGDPPEHRS